jgi:processive 1,2-diacylglycerol beta-glucosyltransferase
MMIDLYNAATNQLLGSITEADLQVLIDALEEESDDDQDYYIDQATIEFLADGRPSDHLLGILREALGSNDGMEIRWEKR